MEPIRTYAMPSPLQQNYPYQASSQQNRGSLRWLFIDVSDI